MPYRKTTTSTLRKNNSFKILNSLYKNGVKTRTELSKELRLSLPTVMRIVQPYMNDLLVVKGKSKSTGGRRAERILFNYSARKIGGIQIERDFFTITISSLNRTPIIVERIPFDCTSPSKLSRALNEKLFDYVKKGKMLSGDLEVLTIAVAGIIDEEAHSIAADFPLKWKNVFYDNFFKSDFYEAFPNCNVIFENDANALAVGEYVERKLMNESLIALYLGRGIGAGVIVNGRLWRGSHGRAGEIGKWIPIFNGKSETFESYFNRSESSKKIEVILSMLSDLAMLFDPSTIVLAGNVDELYEQILQNIQPFCGIKIEKSAKKELSVVGGALAISANKFIKKIAYKDHKYRYEVYKEA